MFWPGQGWICEQKLCYPCVPSLGQKQLHGLALSGTLNAQVPGVPDMMDRRLQSWPPAAFWGM